MNPNSCLNGNVAVCASVQQGSRLVRESPSSSLCHQQLGTRLFARCQSSINRPLIGFHAFCGPAAGRQACQVIAPQLQQPAAGAQVKPWASHRRLPGSCTRYCTSPTAHCMLPTYATGPGLLVLPDADRAQTELLQRDSCVQMPLMHLACHLAAAVSARMASRCLPASEGRPASAHAFPTISAGSCSAALTFKSPASTAI